MLAHLHDLYDSRELLYSWTKRDFKVRYSQSVLGVSWAILQPFSLMIVFSVVFSVFVNVPTDGIPYPIFAYTALLPWTFFANSVSFGIPSLINNMQLVSKIYFPREVLPISAILVSFIDFVIASSIFGLMLLYYQVPLRATVLLVPLVLFIQVIFTTGVTLFGAALTVFYRDIRFVIPLMLQLLMYLAPIIYPTSLVPESLRGIYFLNPMAVVIDTYRRLVLFGQMPDWAYLFVAIVVSCLVGLAGLLYFKRAERLFADLI